MEGLEKKVGYLKGLMDSAKLDAESENGRILSAMYDVLNELTDRVHSIDELLDDLNDYVESIDDDLAELEGDFPDGDFDFDDDDEEDMDFEDDDEPEPLRIVKGREDDEPEPLSLSGCVCPKCGKMFFAAADDPEDAKYVCPHCGKTVQPDPLTPDNAPVAKRAK